MARAIAIGGAGLGVAILTAVATARADFVGITCGPDRLAAVVGGPTLAERWALPIFEATDRATTGVTSLVHGFVAVGVDRALVLGLGRSLLHGEVAEHRVASAEQHHAQEAAHRPAMIADTSGGRRLPLLRGRPCAMWHDGTHCATRR